MSQLSVNTFMFDSRLFQGVHVYVYIYIYFHIHIFIYTHIYIHICVHVRVPVQVHVHMYIHLHLHIHVHVHVHIHTRIRIHIYIYTYSYTHVQIVADVELDLIVTMLVLTISLKYLVSVFSTIFSPLVTCGQRIAQMGYFLQVLDGDVCVMSRVNPQKISRVTELLQNSRGSQVFIRCWMPDRYPLLGKAAALQG